MSIIDSNSISLKQFDDIKIESNFGLIKCYKLVFSIAGKLKNIGFWIFLFFVSAHIPLLFSYFCKGIEPIKEYIIKEMEKNGYITNNNNKKNIVSKKTSFNSLKNPPKKNVNNKNKERKINKVKYNDDSSINSFKSSKRNINNIIEIKINKSKDNKDLKKQRKI